jgi:excisionase family DNA binding protein
MLTKEPVSPRRPALRLALSIPEAAAALAISPRFLELKIERGEIASLKIGARRVVPIAVLEKLIAEAR